MKGRHILINETLADASKPCINYDNRGFLWGDNFTIKLRGNSGFIYDFDRYFECIIRMLEEVGMEKPYTFTADSLAQDIRYMLQKNRIYKECLITITFFRNSTSTDKLTDENTFSTIISSESIDYEHYQINKNGIFIKYLNIEHDCSNYGNTLELRAKKVLEEEKLDDLILIDSSKTLSKTIFSNILFIKGNCLITTYSSQFNTINNVITRRLLEIAKNMGMEIKTGQISEDLANSMDEAFLLDPIHGIRWITGIEKLRFKNIKTNDLAFELMNFYKKQIEPKVDSVLIGYDRWTSQEPRL